MLDDLPTGWGDQLADDTVLPSQFYDRRRRNLEPEQMLLVAVLSDAIHCALDTKNKRHHIEACWWIFNDPAREDKRALTFIGVCAALDIEPQKIRSLLKQNVLDPAAFGSINVRTMSRRVRGPVTSNFKAVSKLKPRRPLKSIDSIG